MARPAIYVWQVEAISNLGNFIATNNLGNTDRYSMLSIWYCNRHAFIVQYQIFKCNTAGNI